MKNEIAGSCIILIIFFILAGTYFMNKTNIEYFEDVKCRRLIEDNPKPPFTKITGRSGSRIDQIQFHDSNDVVLESGLSDGGQPFEFKCPSGKNIVSYDIKGDNKTKGESIFLGFGPVYCADGTVIGPHVGEKTDGSSSIGDKPNSMLTKFKYIPNKSAPIDDKIMGKIKGASIEECGYSCDLLKANCGWFSYDNSTNLCGLGKTYDENTLKEAGTTVTYKKE